MPDWILLSLISGLALGLYDVAKKTAVRDNAVPVVLLLNVSTAAFIWSIPVTVSWFSGNGSSDGSGCVDGLAQLSRLTPGTHALLFSKSLLVGASWTCAFFSLKHLPISVAAPIRATSPLWTVLIAVTLFGERPGIAQWFGVGIVVAAFVAFSRVGAREGIHFTRDRFVTLMMVATLLGAVSAIYDKYLLQTAKLSPAVVQAWFSIYLVPVMLPLAFRWWRVERQTNPFQWRASIPLIAIFLLIADFAYFTAVSSEGALISVISPLRRAAIIIPFLFGIVGLRERNWRAKTPCVIVILIGVFLLSRG